MGKGPHTLQIEMLCVRELYFFTGSLISEGGLRLYFRWDNRCMITYVTISPVAWSPRVVAGKCREIKSYIQWFVQSVSAVICIITVSYLVNIFSLWKYDSLSSFWLLCITTSLVWSVLCLWVIVGNRTAEDLRVNVCICCREKTATRTWRCQRN